MNNKVLKIRIILWSVLAIVVLWLFYLGIVPSGKITYTYKPCVNDYFIKKFTPAERVECKDNILKIKGDPAYFSLKTPRRFETAKVSIKFNDKNLGDHPLVEMGILADKLVWQYDLKPVVNKILDYLIDNWEVIREGQAVFLQKEKKYKSINEFLKNLPPKDEIATYNYDLKYNYLLADYKASDGLAINQSLRGPYKFYTYLKNEALDYKFSFLDLNKNKDKDDIEINLYFKDNLIDSQSLTDDGNSSDNGMASSEKTAVFKISDLPEGVYSFEVKANDDIVTKKIETKQSKLSFINKIWLLKFNGGGDELVTDANKINAQTINPGNLQTIEINDGKLDINEAYKQFSLNAEEGVKDIKLKKDDIILSGDGVFAFSRSEFLNSALKQINENYNPNDKAINYIIANYEQPAINNDEKTAVAEFDLTRAYNENNKYNFLISVPGLRAENETNNSMAINEVIIELQGKSLIQYLKKFIKQ